MTDRLVVKFQDIYFRHVGNYMPMPFGKLARPDEEEREAEEPGSLDQRSTSMFKKAHAYI